MKHSDCVNFCPIDVAKGICRVSNQMIFVDTEVCGDFTEASKCRNCGNFRNQNKDNIGTCVGLKKESWTFAELSAVTCEGYRSIK